MTTTRTAGRQLAFLPLTADEDGDQLDLLEAVAEATAATPATARRIGTCRWNAEHRFIAETAPASSWCPLCEPVTVEWYGRPQVQRASIKWATVKARTTGTRCSEVCTSAHSDKCACECGGRNHGRSLGLAY